MPGGESDPRDEWLRYPGVTEDQKVLLRRGRTCSSPPVFGAIFLIVAGVLLFLNSLGWLPVRHIWDFWPLVFVWMGVGRLVAARNAGERMLGIFFICAGALVLLFTLHILTIRARDGTWPLALLLILFGSALLIKALQQPVRAPIGFQVAGRGSVDERRSAGRFDGHGRHQTEIGNAEFSGRLCFEFHGERRD